jgi:hypothetical protein
MAFLTRRVGGRIEIRETLRTERGPRSRTLAGFRGALSPEVLEAAAVRAVLPFDREALAARARELGIPVVAWSHSPAARQLLGQIRRGDPIDPILVGLLRDELAVMDGQPVPDALTEVAEWLGASDAERGHALRGLLRLSDRIAGGRRVPRARRRRRFPRIASGDRKAA